MADGNFIVSNAAGMWLRTEPVISEATKKVLLPKGQVVIKLGDSDQPDWWHISTTFQGNDLDGFSNRKLLAAEAPSESTNGSEPAAATGLVDKTLLVLKKAAPKAVDNYLQAISQGGPLFD